MVDAEVVIDETNYQTFAESIVYYYMKNDMEKFSLLFIGKCIQTCGLIQLCKNVDSKERMIELARNCIAPVPTSVVRDKSLLFSIIVKNYDKSLVEIIPIIYEAVFSDDNVENDISEKSTEKISNVNKYLFLSYSSKDYDIAENIREMLENRGISCWMAPISIPGGADYTEVIVDAIEKSSGIVLMLTENSQRSKWVPKELDIAITADKVIIPVHMDSSEIMKKIHFRITDSQMIEVYGDISSVFEPLVDAVHNLWNIEFV